MLHWSPPTRVHTAAQPGQQLAEKAQLFLQLLSVFSFSLFFFFCSFFLY